MAGLYLSWRPEALVGENRAVRGRLRGPAERGERQAGSTRGSTTMRHHPLPLLHLLPRFVQHLVQDGAKMARE
jgi:hypothetical protein